MAALNQIPPVGLGMLGPPVRNVASLLSTSTVFVILLFLLSLDSSLLSS
jgi:hypothetical protein